MTEPAAPQTRPLSVLQRASSGLLGGGEATAGGTGPRTAPGSAWPAMLLAGLCVAVFAGQIFGGLDPAGLGLSARGLAEGRWSAIATHMFTHAGLGHLSMNAAGLMALGPVVMSRFGAGPGAWLRFMGLYFAAGLAGAALFLAVNPVGAVPMVGASGAIFGLWGAAARIGADGGFVPLTSPQVRREVVAALKANVVLFAILFVLVRLSGGVGGLAWEAHLGGFLLGLLLMPRLAPGTAPALQPAV